MRFSIHSSLFMAPLLLLGCGSSGWKEYKSPDGAFTVQLPGSPTVKQVEDGWQKISSNVAEEKALLSIRFKDFPTELSKAEFERVTKTSRETLAAREGNKLMSEKSIAVNGYAGMEFEVALGHFDDVSISRAYAVGKRYYSLTAIVPKKNASSANVRKFLDSFQVTGRTGG